MRRGILPRASAQKRRRDIAPAVRCSGGGAVAAAFVQIVSQVFAFGGHAPKPSRLLAINLRRKQAIAIGFASIEGGRHTRLRELLTSGSNSQTQSSQPGRPSPCSPTPVAASAPMVAPLQAEVG